MRKREKKSPAHDMSRKRQIKAQKQIDYIEREKISALKPTIEKRLTFKESEYEDMLVPVHRLSEEVNIIQWYKKFQQYKEFSVDTVQDKNKLLRYIVLMYDFNSPFKNIKDLIKRKTLCALEAGFEQDDTQRFDAATISMMICSDAKINQMIISFLSFFNNHEYSYLVALLEGYRNELLKIVEGDAKNLDLVQTYREQIKIMEGKMTNEDTSDELRHDLYAYVESRRLELRPEDIATKISLGESPLPGTEEEPKFTFAP